MKYKLFCLLIILGIIVDIVLIIMGIRYDRQRNNTISELIRQNVVLIQKNKDLESANQLLSRELNNKELPEMKGQD